MNKISVVFHTHWDREWYYSVDTYNLRLLKVIRRIKELIHTKQIDYFVLDGQVKVIEDYFSLVDKDERNEVINLIKSGRLIIGPWYVLSDEFLVSGESLIRNLEMGIKISKEIYNYQNIGYLPDTFGHVSQMPQILKKFGIEQAILWRGVLPKDTFFNWESGSKDQVFVVFLKEGYYQPIIDQDDYQQRMKSFIEKYRDFSKYHNILLTNGGDHLVPAKNDIPEHINQLKKIHSIEIEMTNYEKYIESIHDKESYETIVGELRDNANIYVLPNVLSTRYSIKKRNQEIEDSMKILEGLIARNHLFSEYENQTVIDQIWKQILMNHPHDSICGCSIDDVHREMDVRFTKIKHQIDGLIKEEYLKIGTYTDTINNNSLETSIFDDDTRFNLYNSSLRRINEIRTIKLFLNKENQLCDQFIVSDGTIDYSTVIINKEEKRIFESPLDSAPQFKTGFEYEVAFRVKDLKGLSNKNYFLKSGEPIDLVQEESKSIENSLIKLNVEDDGSITVFDKFRKKTYQNLNTFYSSLDQGDEYNYSKPSHDTVSLPKLKAVHSKKSDLYQELNIVMELEIPSSLMNRNQGSLELVTNTINCKVKIYKDNPTLYLSVKYTNHAKDQRTRVVFDLQEKINHHYSDTAFDIVKRTVREEEFLAEKHKEVKVVVDPSLSLITTDNGFTFHHLGMQEYQIVRKDHDFLEVTMLRSVGRISMDDLNSRGGGAGPSMHTPDAQMIGSYDYEYSINLGECASYKNTDYLRLPLIVQKGHVEENNGLFTLEEENIHVSSIRKDGSNIELRLFNPTLNDIEYELKSPYKFDAIKQTDFLGNTVSGNELIIRKKEIKTLKISLSDKPLYKCDAVVVGGGIGGVRAAVKLLEKGKNVILTEETNWLGGQLSSQAVPLDEHPFIEEFGCTKSYRDFRNQVRKHYVEKYDLDKEVSNPGGGWVTRLAFEPSLAAKMFQEMVDPYIGNNLKIFMGVRPIKAKVNNNVIESITIENMNTHEQIDLEALYFLDGTELGDLLPITNTDYVTGSESISETNEPHAPLIANKKDMQPITHVAALRWNSDNKIQIKKPRYFDYFYNMKNTYTGDKIFSKTIPDASTGKGRLFEFYGESMSLWNYRKYFSPSSLNQKNGYEKTLLNWPQNDYYFGNIIDDEFDDVHRMLAKEFTLSFIYYLQNEAERPNGGKGYPEIELITDSDELGTTSGLAQYPYIRESRRIRAITTIFEQDILGSSNQSLPHVEKSVGIGCYHIDLHITTKTNRFFYAKTWPYEIPLGAFIPITSQNLIPSCKNIGTTHLSNGAFRLHPVEWNIGEVAGLLCSTLLDQKISMKDLYNDSGLVNRFQKLLKENGIELHWPEEKVHII